MSAAKPASSVCRICHSAATASAALLTPCGCRGTCSGVHAACLEEWISRRMRSGTPLPAASTCEICLSTYAHDLHKPHPLSFLLGRGAWRRWAHVAYMAFVARRMGYELGLVARVVAVALAPAKKPRTRDVVSRVAFSALMAVHYSLFLVLDARHLWGQFKKWRDAASRVVVKDRDASRRDV